MGRIVISSSLFHCFFCCESQATIVFATYTEYVFYNIVSKSLLVIQNTYLEVAEYQNEKMEIEFHCGCVTFYC